MLLNLRSDIISKAWGGAQPNISQTILKRIKIPLPSVEEQKYIVKVLEEKLIIIKTAIKFRQEVLADSKKILSACLYEVFLNGLACGWGVKKMNEFSQIKTGGTPSKQDSTFWQGDIPWVSPKATCYPRFAARNTAVGES